MEQTTLYYRQGSSDKIYQTSIQAKDGGFVVNFAYGRRGTTLQVGTKTQTAVNYGAAKGIYDKLIKEKIAKGYTPGETGTPYQHTDTGRQSTGVYCQLLNPIEESDLAPCIKDPAYWMQEKFDGRRLLIQKEGDSITGINRLGLVVAIPKSIEQSAKAISGGFIIDGEAVGETLYAFDLLQRNGEDLRPRVYAERFLTLLNLLNPDEQSSIKLAPSAFMAEQKKALLDQLKAANKEGVVFKRLDAPYIAGRPSTGGTQLKYKFCETASFIVSKVNSKRSVSLSLLDDAEAVRVGNVTIPTNHEIPEPGQVVEVRYLYAFKGGSIYQPVYLGPRDDIPADECLLTQLKYKPEQEKEAA